VGTSWNPAAGDLFAGGLVASFVGALWAWGLALVLGASLVPRPSDDPHDRGASLLSWLVVGIWAQTLVWLVLSFARQLWPATIAIAATVLTLAACAVGGRRLLAVLRAVPSAASTDPPALRWTATAVVALVVAVAGRLALWPTVFYDDLVYHVASPRQALLTGSWPAMPGMSFSFMPAGWDAAYLLPLALGGGVGPQLMNVGTLALFAWAVFRLARLGGGGAAAWAVTALLVAAPVSVSLGAFAGNDLFVGLALVVALERVLATSGTRPVLAGLLAGAAWAAKYTALVPCAAIGLAAALVSTGSVTRRLTRSAVVGVVALLVGALWTLRCYLLTGNPVYPAFYGLLGGRYWDAQSAEVVARTVSHGGLESRGAMAFVSALGDLVLRSGDLGFPSGLNPLFVLLGVGGLLCLRRVRAGGALVAAMAVIYAGWCVTSLNLRYGLVLLAALAPFAAAALQAALDFTARRGWDVARRVALPMLLVLATAGPLGQGITRHVHYYGNATSFLDATPRHDMQVTRLHLAAAGRALAETLPRDARILLVAEGRIGLLPRPALASSAYDRPDIARFVAGARTVAEINRRLDGFTHVVVNDQELARFERKFGFGQRFGAGELDLFRSWLESGLEPVARYGTVRVFRVPATGLAAAAPPP
jgi:hypothetical protein